jgi:hypothetical protein
MVTAHPRDHPKHLLPMKESRVGDILFDIGIDGIVNLVGSLI